MVSVLAVSGFAVAATSSARGPDAPWVAGLGLRERRRALLAPREAVGEWRRRRESLPRLLRDRDGERVLRLSPRPLVRAEGGGDGT